MNRVILYLAAAAVISGCGSQRQEVRIQQKELTAAVYASGALVPEQEYKVMAGVEGYLSQAMVKEGDRVNSGQLLFVLSSEVRQAQESGAQAVVSQTLPVVAEGAPAFRELDNQITVARVRKAQDSSLYRRYKLLYEQAAVSRASYDRIYLQYQNSLREYQNLRQRREQQELSSALQLQQARNQLSLARAQTSYGQLRSFVSGIVYDVYKKKGDLVTPGQPVALVGSGAMIARLFVDEDDLGQLQEGQKVLITMDAFPDRVFKAHISRIYPLLNKVEQSFRVDAVFDDTLSGSVYGLNLEANIVVAEHKKVQVLPKQALMKGDSVLIRDGSGERRVKIRTGVQDDEFVEITGGLPEDAVVIITP